MEGSCQRVNKPLSQHSDKPTSQRIELTAIHILFLLNYNRNGLLFKSNPQLETISCTHLWKAQTERENEILKEERWQKEKRENETIEKRQREKEERISEFDQEAREHTNHTHTNSIIEQTFIFISNAKYFPHLIL